VKRVSLQGGKRVIDLPARLIRTFLRRTVEPLIPISSLETQKSPGLTPKRKGRGLIAEARGSMLAPRAGSRNPVCQEEARMKKLDKTTMWSALAMGFVGAALLDLIKWP
jgi:hypothetical protein